MTSSDYVYDLECCITVELRWVWQLLKWSISEHNIAVIVVLVSIIFRCRLRDESMKWYNDNHVTQWQSRDMLILDHYVSQTKQHYPLIFGQVLHHICLYYLGDHRVCFKGAVGFTTSFKRISLSTWSQDVYNLCVQCILDYQVEIDTSDVSVSVMDSR